MHRKCDVLYIHSAKNPECKEDNTRYGVMPVGIIAILNTLRGKGYRVTGINTALETALDPEFSLSAVLENMEYKVLLTDLHWYEHSFGAMYIAEQSKNSHPEIPVVIGGYTTTLYGREILTHFSAVDYAVIGDSDLPLEMLVDKLMGNSDIPFEDIPNLIYRSGTEVLSGEKAWTQTTLDDLDFIPVDFFWHAEDIPFLSANGHIENRTANRWICIARGCLYNCAYCCGARDNMQALFGRCNILKRSAKKVADDFIRLAESGHRVSPSHDLQMFGKMYYGEIFERIRQSGQRPAMYLELFQLPTKDFIDDVEKTFDLNNTILEISPISGNDQLRKENGKVFTNDQLYEIVRYIISKGIKIQLYYTVNPVGETREQFKDTLLQMQYMLMVLGLRSVFYQRVVIDPLAGMREWDGVKAEYNSFMDYYRYCQIPYNERLTATGFNDQGELSFEEKIRMYETLFSKAKK